jgi:hypothetical protein
MTMTTKPAMFFSFGEAGLKLGLTIGQLDNLLHGRPDIAGMIPKAGGRRIVTPEVLEVLRKAVAERAAAKAS